LTQAETIRVDLKVRGYDIAVCNNGLLETLADYSGHWSAHRVLVVTDRNVEELYLSGVSKQLQAVVGRVDSIALPAGEATKSVQYLDLLWNRFLAIGVDRQTIVVALGGGVIGDLAGFAAASYARGLPWIQFPTTLLAQVDSSVGGKTGINLADGKNMVGAFWQPAFVLIDPATLHSLDDLNYTSGLAEVVKYGVILDRPFFSRLEDLTPRIVQREPEALASIIAECCRLKAQVVAEDETETTGRRAILNYGHTFGHAIESVYGYGVFLHGHAVSIGMRCAAWLAHQMGLLDAESVQRQSALLQALGCATTLPGCNEELLVAAMHRDKKVHCGKLRLVLPTSIGSVELVEAPDDEMLCQAFAEVARSVKSS